MSIKILKKYQELLTKGPSKVHKDTIYSVAKPLLNNSISTILVRKNEFLALFGQIFCPLLGEALDDWVSKISIFLFSYSNDNIFPIIVCNNWFWV